MDLLYVAGSVIQIFHERSKIVDLSLGHTVQRCKFFTKDPELWTLLCTAGSEVQVSLLNFKVVNFDKNIPALLRSRISHISVWNSLFPRQVLRSPGGRYRLRMG